MAELLLSVDTISPYKLIGWDVQFAWPESSCKPWSAMVKLRFGFWVLPSYLSTDFYATCKNRTVFELAALSQDHMVLGEGFGQTCKQKKSTAEPLFP